MPIKSFRGLIADGGIDTISLHTNNGAIGYKIKKFELIGNDPNVEAESCVQIFSTPVTTVPTTIDFSDQTLLAAALYDLSASQAYNPGTVMIIDNMTFNQDIHLTHFESKASQPVNYYIELEQIRLDLNENTVATLKDIRNIASQ
tara:strand:- start:106 stop:540 length:435 start_codon:yes stop_codon:yes gene_type:complete